MRVSSFFILFFPFVLISCGGGGESSSTKPIVSQNTSPTISAKVVVDSTGDNVIETSESFTIQLMVNDSENDKITGSISIDDVTVELAIYQGNDNFTHQASFIIATKGERTAIITVSDGVNANVISNHAIAVVPDQAEIQELIANDIANFVAGGELDGIDLLGSSTDDLNRTVGYLSTELTEELLKYNAEPSGECGVNRPHKLLKVDVSATQVNVPDTGLIFPLECLNLSQQSKIQQRTKAQHLAGNNPSAASNYVAQHFIITKYDDGELKILQTGVGISVEGAVDSISCAGIVLSKVDENYVINNQQIIDNLASLMPENNLFELSCQRSVNYQGVIENSPLLATITGKLQEIDNTFPTGSIDKVNFSILYLGGGLDQGNICAKATANDNKGIESEVLTLHASDGLTDAVVMDYQNDTQQYCAELIGFDGQVFVNQEIVDFSGNVTTNISEEYLIEKNDAPIFSELLPASVSLKKNQGIVTLIEPTDVSDPEGHTVTLSGDTTFDTAQAVGSYTLIATATDQYGAESTKSIVVDLADNIAPTASISITGEVYYYNGKVRDDNVEVTLSLTSNDKDGHVVSSTLRGDLGTGSFIDIKNYSSTYNAGVYFVGGETLRFQYQVTDNEGKVSAPAILEFEVHKNIGPEYLGQTNYSIAVGDCISIEKQASDPEGDGISGYYIEGSNWNPCFNTTGIYTLEVSVQDDYGQSSDTDITIEVN